MTPDPTYGRIDPDIQQAVDEMGPPGIGERVAWENNLQRRRDAAATPICRRCVADPDWINKRYFSMLDDRDRWELRYHKCRDRLTASRWLIFAASVVAVVGWLR